MKRILVTGAAGQIGSELVPSMRKKYGRENVIAAGHKTQPDKELFEGGVFCCLDVRDLGHIEKIVTEYRIDTIFHLAALLSAAAEKDPELAWDVNINGIRNILETARKFNLSVFFPSSIGAFGPSTPPDNTPQDTIQRPTTIYGITKLTGELLCDYYFHRFGIDVRGLRFPGLISYKTMPRGGTTDYAVEIFYAAVRGKRYECFLKEGTRLDMLYMPDAVRAAIQLMEADPAKLIHRNAFNVTAMSLAPENIYAEIKKHIPDFTMAYKIDPVRQAIADSWPHSMDDSAARKEWGWRPEYNLPAMAKEMIERLSERIGN